VKRLVVGSYNIHGCVGGDGRHDPDRVAAVIRELDADVLALQEVDSREGVENGIDQFRYLSGAIGLPAIPGPTLRDHRGHYGNALVTRLPMEWIAHVDLSVPGREPRAALDVGLHTGDAPLRVIATHLGLGWRERREQVRRLVAHLGDDPGPVLLLGDLNEWIPRSALRMLGAHLGRGHGVRSFPARRPLFALDRIFAHGGARVEALRAHASPLAQKASDHLPVVAEVEIATGR
jgi:endonuclease/exonuclease/phosphatase family metal-dependent hydrolase